MTVKEIKEQKAKLVEEFNKQLQALDNQIDSVIENELENSGLITELENLGFEKKSKSDDEWEKTLNDRFGLEVAFYDDGTFGVSLTDEEWEYSYEECFEMEDLIKAIKDFKIEKHQLAFTNSVEYYTIGGEKLDVSSWDTVRAIQELYDAENSGQKINTKVKSSLVETLKAV